MQNFFVTSPDGTFILSASLETLTKVFSLTKEEQRRCLIATGKLGERWCLTRSNWTWGTIQIERLPLEIPEFIPPPAGLRRI